MKLHLTFFKESGKYYTGGEVEVSDDLRLWDSNFIDCLLESQKLVTNPKQFNIVVNEVEGQEYPAFFKSLFTIQQMKTKLVQTRTHPPFREATSLYDAEVTERFKWDNLSLKEQELLESHIISTSYFGAYSEVFKVLNELEDFMSFYDRVVINYHNLEK